MLQNLTTELQTRVLGRATSNFSQSPIEHSLDMTTRKVSW